MTPSPLYIRSIGTASAAGIGIASVRRTLFGLEPCAMGFHTGLAPDPDRPYYCGILRQTDAENGSDRTRRLIDLCLAQMGNLAELLAHTDPRRVAVVLGACTSGMHRVEDDMCAFAREGSLPGDFDIRRLNLFEPSRYAADKIGALGPVYTVSNACASGLMALESAAALLSADLADVVLTGGCDGFCRFMNAGFSALSAVSAEPCAPFDAARKGINLGEGGALFVLTREKGDARISFDGAGLTTDAYHLSAPEPSGKEAAHAMRLALESARLAPEDIDLVIAHGTGTPLNDAMEARAVHDVFGSAVPCASYKALSGHTLAGAGALQGALAAALLTDNPEGIVPRSTNLTVRDSSLADARIAETDLRLDRPLSHVVVNAFAFGGSNASAVFSRVEP